MLQIVIMYLRQEAQHIILAQIMLLLDIGHQTKQVKVPAQKYLLVIKLITPLAQTTFVHPEHIKVQLVKVVVFLALLEHIKINQVNWLV